jgi:hypothetical protein
VAPFVGASGFLLWGIHNSVFLAKLPVVFVAAVKYLGMTTCFQAGIHWGTAMSLHEQQTDALNSSWKAKIHFALATLPIFGTMFILNATGYPLHEA